MLLISGAQVKTNEMQEIATFFQRLRFFSQRSKEYETENKA